MTTNRCTGSCTRWEFQASSLITDGGKRARLATMNISLPSVSNSIRTVMTVMTRRIRPSNSHRRKNVAPAHLPTGESARKCSRSRLPTILALLCTSNRQWKWKLIYKRRTAVERVNAYLNLFFGLENIRHRKGKRAMIQIDMAVLI